MIPTVVGRQVENTPRQTFSVSSEYRFGGSGFSLNGGAYYLSPRAVNQFNQAFIPGYTLFDLGGAYTVKVSGRETTIRVTAQNLADKRYFSSTGISVIVQGPPRLVKFSVTTRF